MHFVKKLVDTFVLDLFLKKVIKLFILIFYYLFLELYSISLLLTICVLMFFAEDFCVSSPCQNGGTCDNNIDGTDYECVCDGAFKGKNCETKIFQGTFNIFVFIPGTKSFIQ